MMRYWIVRGGQLLWQILPQTIGYAIASALGDCTWWYWRLFDRRRYWNVVENAAWALGVSRRDSAARRVARESVRNYCRYLCDFLRFPAMDDRDIERAIIVKGWDHVDRALADGCGVILVGLHMGNWDLGGAALALRNYSVTVAADSFDPPRLNDLVQGMRRAKGLHVVPADRGPRALMRPLRRNEILGLLVDRPLDGSGIVVEFCGGEVSVPAGAAMLALRTNARIIPAGMVRLEDNRFLAFLGHQLEFEPVGIVRKDVQALTQRIMSSLEHLVQQYPDQWFMFRKMWKGEPCPSST